MTKILVVVESPAKAKTIGKFLGKKYIVKASMGHVRDLPKSQFAVDVENDFSVKYITIRGKGDLIKELKSTALKSDRVLLATDPDREGEAIAWHLQELLNIPDGEKCRIEFNEITKKTITDSVKNPREIDKKLVEAQQTRRVLDRLVGYKLSPLLWRKIRKGLSAGRVQSVAVRLICDREEEIEKFVSEEYWTLTAKLSKQKSIFEAKLAKINNHKADLKNEEQVNNIIADIDKEEFYVEKVNKRQQKRNPAPPFITSTLQQEAYRKLNYAAKKTMLIAQQLYEGIDLSKTEGTVGLITYMRTDSTRVSDEAKTETAQYIEENLGKEYLPDKPRVYTSKGKVQGAHECIRPTLSARTPDSMKQYLSSEQYKLYKLIWSRFIASQAASAIVDVTTVELSVKQYSFKASGTAMIFPGFTKIYIEDRDDEGKDDEGFLPVIQEKDRIEVRQLIPKQHFTQPQPRYSEATLIKTLEENGIGRPSTYAPILDTIITRGYVVKRQKQYFPTELGFVVIDLLKNFFPEIINIEFTANLENQLDSVEIGEAASKEILNMFYLPFQKELETAEQEIGQIEIADEESDIPCEKCGRNMVIKMGRFGKFLACPGFPECRNTKPLLAETGVACPKCGVGRVVVRATRKGKRFFGCSKYPACEYVSWDEPVEGKCPECQSNLLIKRGRTGDRIICSNKECKYEKEVKKVEG